MSGKQACQYSICKPADETQKMHKVRDFVSTRREECGIIFCAASTRAENVCSYLMKSGFPAVCVFPDEDVTEKLQAFNAGKQDILVAVTGTGLQINRPDIRFVLHYNLPMSLEDYLKETSYGGRDGKGGQCVLFYLSKDRRIIENRLKKQCLNVRSAKEQEAYKNKKEQYAELLRICEKPAKEAETVLQQKAAEQFGTAESVRKSEVALKRKYRHKKSVQDTTKVSRRRTDPGALCVCMTMEAERIRRGEVPGISYFDLMTADAAYTLMKHHAKKIFAKHIMEVLSGNRSLTLRPEKKTEIERILRKLTVRGFLSLKEEESGFSYDLSEVPAFYADAEKQKKIGLIPVETLHISGIPTSEENLALTHYLHMKSMSGGEEIPVTDMWKALGVDFPAGTYYKKRKEQTILHKAEAVLKCYKSRGYIREFVISKERLHIIGQGR